MVIFHRINLGITKCYVLECNDGYLLIDTAYSKNYKKFMKELQKLNIKLEEIKYLLLTHHHDDHAGFASKLLQETAANLIVHKKATKGLLAGKHVYDYKPVNNCIMIVLTLFSPKRKHEYPPLDVAKYKTYLISKDESNILKDLCGIDGKIIYTPGHTPDSISIILDSGEAFVGDAAMNFLNFCRIKYRPIYINDIKEVLDSWNKIIQNNSQVIYPAHGRPFQAQELVKYKEFFTKKYNL